MNCIIIITICVMYTLLCIYHKYHHANNIEMFTRDFFTEIKPTYFMGVDRSQLFVNERDLIQTIGHMIPFDINLLLINNSHDRYRDLNDNHVQFILSRSNELYRFMKQSFMKVNNIRFVCSLFDVPISVLSSNIYINELNDLKNSKLTINVGPKNSNDCMIAIEILSHYRLIEHTDIFLSYYDYSELLEHYGRDVDLIFLTRTHPDMLINTLTNHKLTRLIDISKYNDGYIYNISSNEREFYVKCPYFSKHIINKKRLIRYYSHLAMNKNKYLFTYNRNVDNYQSNFINTMSVKYYLLSNVQTPIGSIYQLLYNIKMNLHKINQKPYIDPKIATRDFANFQFKIDTHMGASNFFHDMGIYSYISNYNCLLINGRCNETKLKKHHLL
jgi:TRAP-type uncharacterized transport system substrate-binding protein